MTKLLWCSDHPILPTGYAQVTRNLLSRFKQANIESHCFGFQLGGTTLHWCKTNNMYLDFPIYHPAFLGENYGDKGSIVYWNNNIKPDITAFLCDSFMIKHLFDVKYKEEGDKLVKYFEKDKLVGKKLFYFPFDSQDVYTEARPVVEGMDIRVAMSKFGQKILKEQTGLDSFYIPHGVDTNIYRPLPKSIIEMIKKENNWDKKFVVGCVARNQSRKQLTRLIEAFKIFAENKDDVVLFMHTHPHDPAGNNLIDFSKKIKIENKIVYSGMVSPFLGVPQSQMNVVYNCMDIHVLPTTGEGFGLPIIESMSCGVPNLCTEYTTAKELLEGHGEMAKITTFVSGDKNTDRAFVDVEDLAKKMDKLYYDKNLRERYSVDGRKFVLDNFNWEKVVRAWLELFEWGEIKEKFA